MQFQLVACRIVAADGAARLHRHAGVTPDLQLQLHDDRRRAKGRVDIAVALANDGGLAVAAGRERGRRRARVEHHRQILDLDDHQIGGIFRDIRILGEDRRDRVADIAHAIGCEHRLPVGFEVLEPPFAKIDRGDVGNIGGGPDREHSG